MGRLLVEPARVDHLIRHLNFLLLHDVANHALDALGERPRPAGTPRGVVGGAHDAGAALTRAAVLGSADVALVIRRAELVHDGFHVKHAHLPPLTDAMRPGDRLFLVLWVRVRVVDDHGIGGLEVKTSSGGADGEEEDELFGPRRVELRDRLFPHVQRGAPVDAAPLQALARGGGHAPLEVVLQQVQEFGHGGEEQDPVTGGSKLDQHPVQHPELAAGSHQVRAGPPLAALVGRVVQSRVVAHLPQLHAPVLQRQVPFEILPRREPDFRHRWVHPQRTRLVHPIVHRSLIGTERAVHRDGDLGWELRFHVLDEAPQHERLEDLVKAGDDDDLLLLLHPVLALAPGCGAFFAIVPEPLLEHLGAIKHRRQQEVEQRPQLAEIVLQRRAREQKPAVASEPVEVPRQLPFPVLEPLRLVDYDVLPVNLAQLGAVPHDELVRGDQHVKLQLHHLRIEQLLPLLPVPHVVHRAHVF